MNSQGNIQKKSNAGSITISDFKLYYKAIDWHKTDMKTSGTE
jgi:hypothetical protein